MDRKGHGAPLLRRGPCNQDPWAPIKRRDRSSHQRVYPGGAMKPNRIRTAVLALLLASVPTGVLVSACSKPEPPPPGPLASDDDDKKKPKKKKSTDDDDPKPVGGDDTVGAADAAPPKYTGPVGTGGSKSDSDKAKLIACCTALRNAATAAGIANSAASAAVPGLP